MFRYTFSRLICQPARSAQTVCNLRQYTNSSLPFQSDLIKRVLSSPTHHLRRTFSSDGAAKRLIGGPLVSDRINAIHTCGSNERTPSLLRTNLCHTPSFISITPQRGDMSLTQTRCFHAKGSKVRYLDYRYKLPTGHLRSHLLIIRRQKMKKHQRRKFRKKYKCLLMKTRLKRLIAKEKAFRVELLTMIRRAEEFDPREYALRKIRELERAEKVETREMVFEKIREKYRINRYQTDYVKPRHKKCDEFGIIQQVYQEFTAKV